MALSQVARDIVGADPDAVFAFVTDIDALPTWNDGMAWVEQRPESLTPGAVWKIRMHQGPVVWMSRSVVVEHNTVDRVFVHRSGTDDGNPSYTEWRWSVVAETGGCTLTVEWQLRPETHLRRWFIAPVRSRRLQLEVPGSLDRLEEAFRHTHPDR